VSVQYAKEGLARRVRWAIHDGLVLTKRNLLRYVRIPTLLVFSTVQPVMFVLLFRYVFGGAIGGLPFGISYVDFLIPGIIIQTAIFGATQTGIGLAEDLNVGIIDRFRSLPMDRAAVLAGRTTADLFRNLFVVMLMIGVGYLTGFRFSNGFVPAVVGIGLAVAVGFAFSWISATIGLAIKNLESVQAASFIWIFPLTFASSAFVPIVAMPSWLQVIARNNPVTIWANTLRVLVIGDPFLGTLVGHETALGLLLKSVAWIALILAIFVPLSIRIYRRA
jgi:ABC-2 type transport system permease protein/oleandomycin transport system permease protein